MNENLRFVLIVLTLFVGLFAAVVLFLPTALLAWPFIATGVVMAAAVVFTDPST